MSAKNRRQMLQLALAGAGLGVFGAEALSEAASFRRAGVAFDTTVGLTVVGLDEREAQEALDAGFAEIRRLERIAGLSTRAATSGGSTPTGGSTGRTRCCSTCSALPTTCIAPAAALLM